MAFRYTFLFDMNTAPGFLAHASVHKAGWSESFWRNGFIPLDDPWVNELATARALLLPATAKIVGIRVQEIELQIGSLVRGPVSGRAVSYPGGSWETDLPQVSLMFSGTSSQGNSSRFAARCIPDIQMSQGEYQPTNSFRGYVAAYCASLVNRFWGFLGKDGNAPAANVLRFEDNRVNFVGDPPAGLNIGESVRFRNTKDQNGKEITGIYRLISFAPGESPPGYFFQPALPAGVIASGGSAQVVSWQVCLFTTVNPARAVVRKVGRPFEQYRGRASKRRA